LSPKAACVCEQHNEIRAMFRARRDADIEVILDARGF
jgi:hypothetical protein